VASAGLEGSQFSSLEQANHILQLVMKHMSGMIPSLMAEPQEFRLCSTSAGNSRAGSTSAKEWCTGFMQGMTLRHGSEPTRVMSGWKAFPTERTMTRSGEAVP
jgi:yecA family protein